MTQQQYGQVTGFAQTGHSSTVNVRADTTEVAYVKPGSRQQGSGLPYPPAGLPAVNVSMWSPGGNIDSYMRLDPAAARALAIELQGAADLAEVRDRGNRAVQCVCVHLGHVYAEKVERCDGTGDANNGGYCYGCRTIEYGTVGSPGNPPTHEPMGAAAWPQEVRA